MHVRTRAYNNMHTHEIWDVPHSIFRRINARNSVSEKELDLHTQDVYKNIIYICIRHTKILREITWVIVYVCVCVQVYIYIYNTIRPDGRDENLQSIITGEATVFNYRLRGIILRDQTTTTAAAAAAAVEF